MSNLSNDHGRAFEYAVLKKLEEEIKNLGSVAVTIVQDSGFRATERAWKKNDDSLKSILKVSAASAIDALRELEPIIFEDGDDEIELKIQTDRSGIEGDVRDLLIIRNQYDWEIGLSIKHNHKAVKHSRLSNVLDFGNMWYGVNCSNEYWQEVNAVFDLLEDAKSKRMLWRDLPDKMDDVYVPILEAFIGEITRAYEIHGKIIPKRMIEYLIGNKDFYKVMGDAVLQNTTIQAYNIKGTLNKESRHSKPITIIWKTKMPDRIVKISFKPNSKTTIEMYLNNGWQLSFRIHNASTRVETSLKFDIQLIGKPETIYEISKNWV